MVVFLNSEMEKAKQNLVDCLLLEVSIDHYYGHLVISIHFDLPRHLYYQKWKETRYLFHDCYKFTLIYTRFLIAKIARYC